MRLRTTSTQRTYRYVRLAIVGTVVFLAASLAAQIVAGGGVPSSVSAAYYTPAQPVFVAALSAVALALLALSGRSVEQALLDLAALFAPIVAFVPTPVEVGDVPGYVPDCPGEGPCVPTTVLPAVANGMLALGVIAVVGYIVAVVLARAEGTLSPSHGLALAGSAAIVPGMLGWWWVAPDSFLLGAHDAAAGVFFALIAVVAGVGAFRPHPSGGRRRARIRLAYAGIAAGILLALVSIAVVAALRAVGVDLVDASGAPLIFWGEAVALLLFAVFWVVQTVEFWNDTDPPTLAA